MKLAVHRKGGIGESTTICNIFVALVNRGEKVLQIGCNLEQDSLNLDIVCLCRQEEAVLLHPHTPNRCTRKSFV